MQVVFVTVNRKTTNLQHYVTNVRSWRCVAAAAAAVLRPHLRRHAACVPRLADMEPGQGLHPERPAATPLTLSRRPPRRSGSGHASGCRLRRRWLRPGSRASVAPLRDDGGDEDADGAAWTSACGAEQGHEGVSEQIQCDSRCRCCCCCVGSIVIAIIIIIFASDGPVTDGSVSLRAASRPYVLRACSPRSHHQRARLVACTSRAIPSLP